MATTFSVGSGDYIRPYRNVRIQHYPVAVSQTIVRGAFVRLSTTATQENRIKLAAITDTSGLVGVAAENITTTATHVPATDKIAVWVADANAEFIGRLAVARTVDFTKLGLAVGMVIDATNAIWVVETADVTTETVSVINFLDPVTKIPQTVEGDTSALVLFKFIAGSSIFAPGILA
jgi:predicted NBD/HSP70 family sugar kinase